MSYIITEKGGVIKLKKKSYAEFFLEVNEAKINFILYFLKDSLNRHKPFNPKAINEETRLKKMTAKPLKSKK